MVFDLDHFQLNDVYWCWAITQACTHYNQPGPEFPTPAVLGQSLLCLFILPKNRLMNDVTAQRWRVALVRADVAQRYCAVWCCE